MPFSGGFFPGGIEGTENGLVLLSVVAALLYLVLIHEPVSPKRTLVKAGAILLLLALAIYSQAPGLLIAALAFSAVGDAALAQDGDHFFMLGLGAFLIAHVAYAILFFSSGGGFESTNILISALILLFAIAFGFILVRKAGSLAIPVALYILAILSMGLGAATLGGAVLFGAVLFIISDAILGSEKFLIGADSAIYKWTSPAIWLLYFIGQATLTIGVIRLFQLA